MQVLNSDKDGLPAASITARVDAERSRQLREKLQVKEPGGDIPRELYQNGTSMSSGTFGRNSAQEVRGGPSTAVNQPIAGLSRLARGHCWKYWSLHLYWLSSLKFAVNTFSSDENQIISKNSLRCVVLNWMNFDMKLNIQFLPILGHFWMGFTLDYMSIAIGGICYGDKAEAAICPSCKQYPESPKLHQLATCFEGLHCLFYPNGYHVGFIYTTQ
ncbi:hypothetical protein SELMODRAFT_409118 [Selaginella moellendorffii]|uniref:Uncharacterized protein n=1 Tax=Selaginella moellendorffii TaxID=88036 RepID=D8RAF0_SELML|nr:hypothetical protein SELMODRAFT_409118 [Selaginella moellendorffii]